MVLKNIKILVVAFLILTSIVLNSGLILAAPAPDRPENNPSYVDSNTISWSGTQFKLIALDNTAFYDQRFGNTTTGFKKLSEAYPELVGKYIYLDTTTDTSFQYCTNFIVLDKSSGGGNIDPSSGTYWDLQHTSRAGQDFCDNRGTVPVNIAGSAENWNESEANNTASGLNPENLTLEEGCTAAMPGIGWFACQIINMVDGVYQFIVERIARLLITNTDELAGLRASWTAVKNVANALLILVALVMIASQIFSLEILSAYTVKKIIPRLLIAAIAIQLSWALCVLAIDLFNALGSGLHNLLLWPFTQTTAGSSDITSLFANTTGGQQSTAGILGIFLAATGVAAVTITALQVGGWLTIVITLLGVLVAILVAFFVILIRGVLILILVSLAPLAVVAWVLPGTQNLWKIWYELFSKLLMMFPLIMLLFAGGAIGANLIADTITQKDGLDAVFALIMMLIVYFAPLFLISATFKFAGKTFGAITAGVNKLQNTGKKSGYGLGQRRDAYNKIKNESAAQAAQARINQQRAKLYGSNSKWSRTRARATMGPSGFLPGSKKRLESDILRQTAAVEAAQWQEAQAQWGGVRESFGDDYSRRTQAERAVALGAMGSSVNIGGKNIEITPALKRAALESAASDKNIGLIEEFRQKYISDSSYQDHNGKFQSQLAPKNAKAQEEFNAYSKAMGNSYGTVVEYAPDIAKSAPMDPNFVVDQSTGRTIGQDKAGLNAVWNDGLRTFGRLKGSGGVAQGDIDAVQRSYGNDVAGRHVKIGQRLQQALSTGTVEEKQSAISDIYTIQRSGSLGDNADAAAYLGSLGGGEVGKFLNNPSNRELVIENGTVVAKSTAGNGPQGPQGGGPQGGGGQGGGPQPGGPQAGGGGGIITPGSPGFNIPPGSFPGGQNNP